MKKKVIALSMMIMGLTGTSVILAQQPNGESVVVCEGEACVPENCAATPDVCLPEGCGVCVAEEVTVDSCCNQPGANQGRFKGKKHCKDGKNFAKGKKCHGPKGKFDKKGKRAGGNPAAIESRIFSGIDLSEAQKAKVKELGEKRAEDSKKIAEDVAKKRAKITKKYDEQLQKILTPEQYAKYKDNLGKMRRGGSKKISGKPVPGKKVQRDGVVGPIVKGPQPVPMTKEKK
ncbi:MAG: hypothetical protein NC328_01790 [Muribaculum sp.]|nr:hypothetical protein [Muribaculum sp.]